MEKKVLTILLTLALTSLACSLPFLSTEEDITSPKPTNSPALQNFSLPTSTPIILVPTVTQPPQPIYEKAQIGLYNSLYLIYDPLIWEAHKQPILNNEEETVYILKHRNHSCTLQANIGRGAPDTWERFLSEKQIGTLTFQVETWFDTTKNSEALIVYQYPTGELTQGSKRIEVEITDHPKECINDAEAVLALSEEEIR